MNGTDHTIRHVTVDKMRRKRLKVVSACQECRRKKTKCNGELPCMSCVKGSIECAYTPQSKPLPPLFTTCPAAPSSSSSSVSVSASVVSSATSAPIVVSTATPLPTSTGPVNSPANSPARTVSGPTQAHAIDVIEDRLKVIEDVLRSLLATSGRDQHLLAALNKSHRIESSHPPSSPSYHNHDRIAEISNNSNLSSNISNGGGGGGGVSGIGSGGGGGRPPVLIQSREKRAYSESEDYGRHSYAGPEAERQPTRSSESLTGHGYPAMDSIDSSSSSFRSNENIKYSAFTPRGSTSSSPPSKGGSGGGGGLSIGPSSYRVRLPPIQSTISPMSQYSSSGSPSIRNLLNRNDACTLPSIGMSRSAPPLLDTLEIDSPSPPTQLPNKPAYSDTNGRHFLERPTPRSPSTSGFYRSITSPHEIGTGSSS
ncbi:hypothetical protein J3Q64DRAFT_1695474 [Phycomyces blakesleeanus]|uniref:Zn(2)-C6 fungal-type domain-containing protein n=1 Tax=Phycomyces blakesleeanus TaxID=4837 RepID=A0ABR3BAB9_PHYBL